MDCGRIDVATTKLESSQLVVPIPTDLGRVGQDPIEAGCPSSPARELCLTCHRAHASPHANSGRWDFEVELLTESHSLNSTNLPAAAVAYYKDGAEIEIATEYDEYQRSLCNKCHVKD